MVLRNRSSLLRKQFYSLVIMSDALVMCLYISDNGPVLRIRHIRLNKGRYTL